MPHYVTEKDVRAIAEYTRIHLADDEVPAMTADLNAIIETLKPITEFDLTGVEPTFHPAGSPVNAFREDAVRPGFSQEEALANAPAQQDGGFRVPRILSGDNA